MKIQGFVGIFLILPLMCAAIIFGACTSNVWGQTASQITPKSFAEPVRAELGGGIVLGASPGLDAPPGADKLIVRLSGFSVAGGFPALSEAEAAIRDRLLRAPVTGSDIFAAARALEAAYANAGYVLTRVVLPPQRIVDDGPFHVVVIDGFIEQIVINNVPERVRERIWNVLAPLQGSQHVLIQDIERRILLAGDTPGVVLRSTLAPGSRTGATILVIDATYQPVGGLINADNSLARSLGRYEIGVGLDLRSVTGLGELTYFRETGFPGTGPGNLFSQDPRNRQLAAGVILPIGSDGLTLNLEGTDARTAPRQNGGLLSNDVFDRLSARLRYGWVRSRTLNLSVELSFDGQDETQRLGLTGVGVPLSMDRLRIIRVGQDTDLTTPWGAVASARIVSSFGLDAFGARSAREATAVLPLSRKGADDTFQKLNMTVSYTQGFADNRLALGLTASGQTAFGQPLLRSEQISIAGPSGLSSFDAGTLQGDSGFAARGELSAPLSIPAPAVGAFGISASPYLFAAGGMVKVNKPTALETEVLEAASYGVGIHLSGTQADETLTIEYGRQARSDAVRDHDRFAFGTSLRF